MAEAFATTRGADIQSSGWSLHLARCPPDFPMSCFSGLVFAEGWALDAVMSSERATQPPQGDVPAGDFEEPSGSIHPPIGSVIPKAVPETINSVVAVVGVDQCERSFNIVMVMEVAHVDLGPEMYSRTSCLLCAVLVWPLDVAQEMRDEDVLSKLLSKLPLIIVVNGVGVALGAPSQVCWRSKGFEVHLGCNYLCQFNIFAISHTESILIVVSSRRGPILVNSEVSGGWFPFGYRCLLRPTFDAFAS